MSTGPSIAVFRPDDDRIRDAATLLSDLGANPVPDPMLAIDATEATPRDDAEYTIFTSKTGVELAAEAGWQPGETTIVAIGERTAGALETAGYPVDLLPEAYTSAGLVDLLAPRVDGACVEVARSDHGSDVLLDGLDNAGAYVHETILYRLTIPKDAGESTERAADGRLDAVLFTSSLTVEHFLEAAADRGVREDARAGLEDVVVGTIGPPTRETAEAHGIDVDVVPESADFEALAQDVVAAVDEQNTNAS